MLRPWHLLMPLVLLLAAAQPVVAQDLAPAPDPQPATAPAPEPARNLTDLTQLQAASSLVVTEADPWRLNDETIGLIEATIDQNVASHAAALVRAERLEAHETGRAEVAEWMTEVAIWRRDEVQSQLAALVVESFMFAEEASIGNPDNEVEQLHHLAPNQVVTDALTALLARTDDEVYRRTIAERDRRDRVATLVSQTALRRREAEQARRHRTQLDQLLAARLVSLAEREFEVLEESKEVDDLVNVGGFLVAEQLAPALGAMLAAAAEEGINFTGWGYRSTKEQIYLREHHCGTSGFEIFDTRALECNPPAANPLLSEHEKGLAIDITQDGAILNRGHSGFAWLVEHGAEYGLINLPSEAWHWSTTGH